MQEIYTLIAIPFGLLAAIICVLAVYFFQFKRRLDLFFKSGEEDLERLLKKQLKESEKQRKEIKEIFEEIAKLDRHSQKSFQKIGLIRFNPFKNVGGDQSFSVALLDLDDNGFVITSLYGREGNRIYAKPINNGKSKYSLSEEEKEAINKAVGLK